MNDIIINNTQSVDIQVNMVVGYRYKTKSSFRRCFVLKLGRLGLWRFYITKNLRLKRSQQRDNEYMTRTLCVKCKKERYNTLANGRCELCGKELEYCSAEYHHILPYHRFPYLMTDINNGLIVCHDCHKMIHNTNPFLNIKLMQEKAKEYDIDLKEHYQTFDMI